VIFRGGHDKHHVPGGLLKSLQKRAEGRIAEHMDFIDDEDLVPIPGGIIASLINELANIVHAGVGRGVNFEHIHAIARRDLNTGDAIAAWLTRLAVVAVQRFRQNPRRGRLPAPSRPGEKKGMGYPAALKCVEQRAGDMFLPYEFMEILGTPFSRENLILHREMGRASGDLLHI